MFLEYHLYPSDDFVAQITTPQFTTALPIDSMQVDNTAIHSYNILSG